MADQPWMIKDSDELSGNAVFFYNDERGLSARADRQGLEIRTDSPQRWVLEPGDSVRFDLAQPDQLPQTWR